MIEFACHSWAFNDLTLPEALGTIARMGFRYVDIGSGANLNAARAAERPRDVAREIKQDLLTFNLKLSDLYLMLPRISVDDEARRAADMALFKSLIPFATELGTPGITLSPGLVHPAEDQDARDRTILALRELVKLGKEASLRVSIEPHLDSMATTPDAALNFIKQVPGLEITLDWAHMICQGIRDHDIMTLLPHTRHVQVRQAARNKLQTASKQGKLNVDEILNALVNADYRGLVCIEYMKTTGWHGMAEVDSITESARLRDAFRQARDQLQGSPS
jgi:sugar phosphate isomerase/epimerase